jgi:hypothetical protein
VKIACIILGSCMLLSCQQATPPPAAEVNAIPADTLPMPPAPPTSPGPAPPSAPPAVADHWVGQWIGPEGSYLVLTKEGDAFNLLIQSLDGPATYDAVAIDDHLEFQRAGELETIRATTGGGTGMKWLQDKKTCLTIKPGEGFCRD